MTEYKLNPTEIHANDITNGIIKEANDTLNLYNKHESSYAKRHVKDIVEMCVSYLLEAYNAYITFRKTHNKRSDNVETCLSILEKRIIKIVKDTGVTKEKITKVMVFKD